MKKTKLIHLFSNIIRIVLGFIFIYASIDKILNPARFAEVIYHYRVLPIELLNIVAILVPWIEIILGTLLLYNIWVETSAFIMSFLTLFFIVLMLSAMARGLNIECGCFSLDPVASMVGWRRIFEDLLMLFGSVFLVWEWYGNYHLESQ